MLVVIRLKERLESYRGGSDGGHGRDEARDQVTSQSIQVPAPPFYTGEGLSPP